MSERRGGSERLSPHTDQTTDEDLITLFTEMGDESAFQRLMERHHGAAIRYAESRIKNHADAEDIVSGVFERVALGLNHFDGVEATFKTWLYRILQNAVIDFTRRAKARPTPDHGINILHLGVSPNQERAFHTREIREKLNEALGLLTPDELEIWMSIEIHGWTALEISQEKGMNVNTVKTRLNRARGKLREALGHLVEGISKEEVA